MQALNLLLFGPFGRHYRCYWWCNDSIPIRVHALGCHWWRKSGHRGRRLIAASLITIMIMIMIIIIIIIIISIIIVIIIIFSDRSVPIYSVSNMILIFQVNWNVWTWYKFVTTCLNTGIYPHLRAVEDHALYYIGASFPRKQYWYTYVVHMWDTVLLHHIPINILYN